MGGGFGSAGEENLAAPVAAFRTQVDEHIFCEYRLENVVSAKSADISFVKYTYMGDFPLSP